MLYKLGTTNPELFTKLVVTFTRKPLRAVWPGRQPLQQLVEMRLSGNTKTAAMAGNHC